MNDAVEARKKNKGGKIGYGECVGSVQTALLVLNHSFPPPTAMHGPPQPICSCSPHSSPDLPMLSPLLTRTFPGMVNHAENMLRIIFDLAGRRARNYIIDQHNCQSAAQRRKLGYFSGTCLCHRDVLSLMALFTLFSA